METEREARREITWKELLRSSVNSGTGAPARRSKGKGGPGRFMTGVKQ